MEHGAKSPSKHQTTPGWSQLAGFLLTLPHTYDQAQTVFQSRVCSRPSCQLPGSWAVSLFMATELPTTGGQVLDKLSTSAPASDTKALLHLPPDTSPSCLPHPMTMRRYSQTQMQVLGHGTLLPHSGACHYCHLIRVLFRGMTVHPHDSHHPHKVAECSSLPTMPASWHGICGSVVLCPGPAGMGRMELTGRSCPGRKERAAACCQSTHPENSERCAAGEGQEQSPDPKRRYFKFWHRKSLC